MTKLHAAIHSFLSSLTISKYIYDHRLPHQTDYECGVLADEALRGETLNGTPSLVSFLRVIEEERFSWRIGFKTTKGIIRVQYSVFDHGFRVDISPNVKSPSLEIIELTPIAGSEEIEVRTEGFLIGDDLNVVKEDKEIHESIAAQNVDGFGEVKFDYGTMRRVMNDILYESAEYARENVGNLLFHGNGHSDRMVKFIYDRHARHLDLIFVINGAFIQRGDRHHIIDESDFRTFQRLHVDDRWGAFIDKVVELMERAVVEAMLDGYLTEDEFFAPPVKYDFASKNESILGTLRTLCAVSSSLKEAMENGGVNKRNMEIWMDEVVASVEALKEHTDRGY